MKTFILSIQVGGFSIYTVNPVLYKTCEYLDFSHLN